MALTLTEAAKLSNDVVLQGVIETVNLIGYYTTLAMLSKVTRSAGLALRGDDAGGR